jgi:hypothetical protein
MHNRYVNLGEQHLKEVFGLLPTFPQENQQQKNTSVNS